MQEYDRVREALRFLVYMLAFCGTVGVISVLMGGGAMWIGNFRLFGENPTDRPLMLSISLAMLVAAFAIYVRLNAKPPA